MYDVMASPFFGANIRNGKSVSLQNLPEEAWQYLQGDSGSSDLKDYYQLIPWLFRGIDLRSNGVAKVPFEITRGTTIVDTSSNYQNAVQILPHPGRLFGKVEAAIAIWGYAYLFKQAVSLAGRAVPTGLRYMMPASMTETIDPATGDPTFSRREGGKKRIYSSQEICYFWKPDPFVEVGRPEASPAKAAGNAAGVVLNADKFAQGYFKRGAIKATLLTVEGPMQDPDRKRLKRWWQRITGGIDKSWQSEVVSGAVKPVLIGEGLEALVADKGMLSQEKREAIATAIGIPHSVLFSNAANFATSQQDDLHFYDKTIVPDCEFIAETLNDQVFGPMGYMLNFLPQEMDIYQEDEEQRAESLQRLVQVLAEGPITGVAMDILGYDLSDEVRERLERIWSSGVTQPNPLLETLPVSAATDELRTWRTWALNQVQKRGKINRNFKTFEVSPVLAGAIAGALENAQTAQDVESVFSDAWKGYP